MTLKELLLSVDAEAYSDSSLFRTLLDVKPEYGSGRHITVGLKDGEVTVSRSTLVALLAKNVHIGSLGGIVAYPIDVAPELNITKMQLLDAILREMSLDGFTETDADDFWHDMMDLQKAKIIR